MKRLINDVELDLGLAIKRLRIDIGDDWFPDPLRGEDILNPSYLAKRFPSQSINYEAKQASQYNLPKPGYTLRYSLEAPIIERLIYQAIADLLIESYDPLLQDSVFNHRLRHGGKKYIFKPAVQAWKDFTAAVRLEMEDRGRVLVVTDLQNFFECITIDVLIARLRELAPGDGTNQERAIALLSSLLKTWSPYRYYGIPQNRDASSFLANIYLKDVDEAMVTAGYKYFRYMDDIRIVCSDEYEAKQALYNLIVELRHLRLNVNSKKTLILGPGDARMYEYIGRPDRRLEQIDSLLKSKRTANVRRAYQQLRDLLAHLIAEGKTDSREFRFCIYRLEKFARCQELDCDLTDFAETIISQITVQPWSTDMLVRFLESLTLTGEQVGRLREIVVDPRLCLYEWQSYHLWSLLTKQDALEKSEIDRLRHVALESIRRHSSEPALAGASLFLGKRGTHCDRRILARELASDLRPFLRRCLLIATQEMSRSDATRYLIPNLQQDGKLEREALMASPVAGQYFQPLYPVKLSEIFDDLGGFYGF